MAIKQEIALVGRCPVCDVMFFACSKRAVVDSADEIAELRQMGIKLEWVSGDAVRQQFEGACEHVREADQMRSRVADWNAFWRILDIMDPETSLHDAKLPPSWEKLLELSPGAGAVIRERLRQIEAKGFDSAHDDQHTGGELAFAAAAYAVYPDRVFRRSSRHTDEHYVFTDAWPSEWDKRWDKRGYGSKLDHAVKAAALMIAEVDRLIREKENRGT